ncbi:hypothetical protein FOZ60_009730 [Perkinsus olseni]|uniref:MULE transposase domain-containing protein n=1 Tax=Perkinsus olseni TaxID=32597 RepID=A0A7J6NHW0_PEROL|nr:hypothetical protein FOZ60_009730 [Perkinsus olseni]
MGINIEHVILDFESGMIRAIQALMPQTTISLCLYHWAAALYRNLCDRGLKTAHAANVANLRLFYDCLRALPLVPSGHMQWAISAVRRLGATVVSCLSEPNKSNFISFLTYFDKTYVGDSTKLPIFDPILWCHANSHERTSNLCEAFHHTLNALCNTSTPTFYYVLHVIVDEFDEFARMFSRVEQGDASRRVTSNRKTTEGTLERAYAATFPEYGGKSWAETPIRLVDEKYIQYLRSCSAALERSKAPTKIAKTKAQQASAPSSGEVFTV